MQEAKLEFVYVRRGGYVGVARISNLCKTSNFALIYPDILIIFTKTRHAPYNVWSSKHPPAGCTLDGNVIVTDQKDTLLLTVTSPSPRNNWGPRCVLFPLLCVGKFFFFHPSRTSCFFFSFPCGSSFFFPSMCGSFFFFKPLSGSSFFFTKTSCSPPLEV